MRLAIALGGTDRGRSGLGAYVNAVGPRLVRRVLSAGGEAVAIGTARDFAAYEPLLEVCKARVEIPERFEAPAANALFHLAFVGRVATRARASVLLLPAANRRMSAIAPVPTVAVVHDLAALSVAGKYDALRTAYVRIALVRALRSARELVAISSPTRRELSEATGRSEDTIRLVPNGVDASRFRPADANDPRVVRARDATQLADPYVLYAARLEHPGKNHVRLVAAFAASALARTHTLALAGADWGGARPIAEAARAHGVSNRVRMLGYVPDALLPGLVAGADVVAMVGLAEGFGLPALEALAAGRPVVAARAGALPEVVGPLGVLCDPRDVTSIARALERAASDDTMRVRVAREGPVWAAARDWDRTAEGLFDACLAAEAS